MKIGVEFTSIEEMLGFAKSIVSLEGLEVTETAEDTLPEEVKIEVQKQEQINEPEEEEKTPEEETTEEETPVYSLVDVRAKLSELTKGGKKAEVQELINNFGTDKLSKIDPTHYPELMRKAGEL